jgi:hypothetical protein
MEALKDIPEGNRRVLIGMKDQGVVMTVRTAKVAVRQEEHGADFSGPV